MPCDPNLVSSAFYTTKLQIFSFTCITYMPVHQLLQKPVFMQKFSVMVSEFCLFKGRRWQICINPVFRTLCDISIACNCYTLHLHILGRQMDESESNISLCMAVMLDHPW